MSGICSAHQHHEIGCKRCEVAMDNLTADDIGAALVDLASRPDRTALWCSTCGKESKAPGECEACQQWWRWQDNPPKTEM